MIPNYITYALTIKNQMTPNLKLSHCSCFQLFIASKIETFLKNGTFCNVHRNEVATSNETMNNLQKEESNLPTEFRIMGKGTIMQHVG